MERDTFVYAFEVLNEDLDRPHRVVKSIFSRADIERFCASGYLVVESLIPPDILEDLRRGTDELRLAKFGSSKRSTYRSQSFAGQYLREPHALDRRFWSLLRPFPIADSVRSILGPRVVLRSYSARITLPGTEAGTKWHRDQRSLVKPVPPLFTEPHVMTCLVYLDDVDERSGLTYLMPDTYRRLEEPPVDRQFEDLEGQVVLAPGAGTVVFLHGATWHRGGRNGPEGRLRRLLIQQYAPAWAQRSAFESQVSPPLYQELIQQARERKDEPTLELLGFGGYM